VPRQDPGELILGDVDNDENGAEADQGDTGVSADQDDAGGVGGGVALGLGHALKVT
jgi:hypothetical protein